MELKIGTKSAYVAALQRGLNEKIGTGLTADGDFGPATERAVMAYQLQQGYETTGVVDTDLFTEICVEVLPQEETMISVDELTSVLNIPVDRALLYITPINKAMSEFEINTPVRIAAFLANIGEETGQLTTFVENLNYSAQGLANTWPKRYSDGKGNPNGLATSIANNQKTIANVTYADRMGNGGPSTGDGWNYRGRGPIMATGKDMYAELTEVLGVDLINAPYTLENPTVGFRAAGYLWLSMGCNAFADAGDFDGTADRINIGRKTKAYGDAIGFKRRNLFFQNAKKLWNF